MGKCPAGSYAVPKRHHPARIAPQHAGRVGAVYGKRHRRPALPSTCEHNIQKLMVLPEAMEGEVLIYEPAQNVHFLHPLLPIGA